MIEELLNGMSPGQAALWLLGLFVLGIVIRRLQVSREISRLGTRSPQVAFRIPYGTHIQQPLIMQR